MASRLDLSSWSGRGILTAESRSVRSESSREEPSIYTRVLNEMSLPGEVAVDVRL
jgi:hypothetical protein